MPEDPHTRSIADPHALAEDAERLTSAGDADAIVAAWRAVLAHPQASTLDRPGILDEIHQALRRAGRYDDAIAAKREAIAAGYESTPDPEADIAECLVEAGRRDEADALFAELRARNPKDPWLNNSAAYVYRGVDDLEARRWAVDGVVLAMAAGDPEQIVGQLLDMAIDAGEAAGEPLDAAFVDRARTFEENWTRPPVRFTPTFASTTSAGAGALDGRMGSPANQPVASGRGTGGRQENAFAWFPAAAWAEATARWPDLLDGLPADHLAYSHRIEATLKAYAAATPGRPVHVAPITIERLDTFAADRGEGAGVPATRARLATEVLRTGHARPWPPARNQPCWCDSGRKYKQCCGPIPAEGVS